MACGMRSITRSKVRVTPASTINTPQATKAPTASPIATPLVPAISAAPGVDQAVSTGSRRHHDKPIDVTPMPRPSAQIHDVAWAGVAPSACAAANTITTELVKPTSTATKPATTAESDASRQRMPWREYRGCPSVAAVAEILPWPLAQSAIAAVLRAGASPAQISTLAPSSTIRLVGRLRKSAAAAALRCIEAKSFSRHIGMPSPSVGMTMSRLRK